MLAAIQLLSSIMGSSYGFLNSTETAIVWILAAVNPLLTPVAFHFYSVFPDGGSKTRLWFWLRVVVYAVALALSTTLVATESRKAR